MLRERPQLIRFLVACSLNNMLLLERQGICLSLLQGLKNRTKRNLNHQTLINDMRAPTFIEISYGQVVIQIPFFFVFTMIIFSDNFYIPSKLALCILRCFAENIRNRFLEFGLLAIQGSFRFQRKRLNIYFRNIMR